MSNYVTLWNEAKKYADRSTPTITTVIRQFPEFFGKEAFVGPCLTTPLDTDPHFTPTPKPFMPIFGIEDKRFLGVFPYQSQKIRGAVVIENLDDAPSVALLIGSRKMDVIAEAVIPGIYQPAGGKDFEQKLVSDVEKHREHPEIEKRSYGFGTHVRFMPHF